MLRQFPESGWIVEEVQGPMLRETVVGSHRIIYRFQDNIVKIINVIHGARILRSHHLGSD
jgi:plasmid stabilization system protein ParE